MKIFLPPLEIGETEGFTQEKDIFGRAIHGQRLTSLISSVDQPLVIALDAQWGGGKTTFLKMWAGELRKAGFPVIYFDAFERDYAEDAFTALASEVISLSAKLKKQNEAKAKQFLQASLQAGKVLIRSGLKIGVKAATIGALAVEDFEDLAKEIGTELSSVEDRYIGDMLTRQKTDQDAIATFRNALKELPALLTADKADGSKPLIFIIDELDRCKPTFALDLLERAKHFFAVENVHFVLGVNMKQLVNSVRLAYGSDVDGNQYLQKFINLVFHLMDRERHQHEETAIRYIQHITKAMAFAAQETEAIAECAPLVRHVANNGDLTLRAIERVFSYLAIAIAFTPKNFFRPPPLLAGLCILKVVRPDLFAKAKQGTLTYDEANSVLNLHRGELEEWYRDFWRIALGVQEPDDDWRRHFIVYRVETKQMVPIIANEVIDRMRQT